jgi:hypothetical protein
MEVSRELILELQTIIFEEYGRKLSLRQTSEIANGLVGYFDLLAKVDYRIKHENEDNDEREN